MVVLLGSAPEHSTVEPPQSVNVKMPRKWILRYLNSRFFEFPAGVTVKVREGWDLPRGDQHNFLRRATGQGPWLRENAEQTGKVRLPEAGATVHWWIIKEGVDTNSGHYAPVGHMSALFQNELYELVSGPAGYARLQSFGIVFGGDRVVLYVEPDNFGDHIVTANTARTLLLIGNEPLDWSGYAAEFRNEMPQELRDYQDAIGAAANQTDHRKAIRERLKAVRELFKFGRYRPKAGGAYRTNPAENTGGATSEGSERAAGSGGGGGAKSRRNGDIYALFAEESGDPADLLNSAAEPEVSWIVAEDNSRIQGDLEDRAARYLADQNKLLINGDFRAFTDMIERWVERYAHVAGARNVVQDVVREWFEQQLIETVMSALALKQSGKWSLPELGELWCDTALTAAILPRYHIDMNIKRVLGQRLGRMPVAA
jgi:hypothetical protein